MICPHLKRTVMPICQAKHGAYMSPNLYELQSYCMSVKYKKCPIFKKSRSTRGVVTEKRVKKEMDNDGTR
jgi:hypothetical protein